MNNMDIHKFCREQLAGRKQLGHVGKSLANVRSLEVRFEVAFNLLESVLT